jgi:hypothetical protein
MAVYKVPQDVEADDKLIGPFSFRQFIYLIIVALACALAWGLGQLFLPLAVLPLPIILFFGAIALPLRKDQPMEVYMAAMVSFYLKPHRRLWNADGIESLIEITVPKVIEIQRVKNISQDEAQERFGYLAQIVDSQGWAVRGVSGGVTAPNTAISSDVYFEAQQAVDVLDANTSAAQSLTQMIGQSDAKRHQELIDRMHQPVPIATISAPTAAPNVYDFFTSGQPAVIAPIDPVVQVAATVPDPHPIYNPYPTDIQQTVIQPLDPNAVLPQAAPIPAPYIVPAPTEQITSEKAIAPGIMNLANNADLSIETIAREANRINHQQDMNEEVVISLR